MYVWNVQESSEALVVTVASDKDNNNFCRDVFSLLALSFLRVLALLICSSRLVKPIRLTLLAVAD